MKQIYSLLIILSTAFVAKAQIPMPPMPAPGNSNNCTTNSTIDVCGPTSNIIVGAHTNGTYHMGNASNNLGIKAIWRYRNMASLNGVSVNVEVTVDTIVNATLVSMDDDVALAQVGVQISHIFAPRISPDQNLNGTNRRGYVQFTMRFYINSAGTNSGTDADFGKDVKLANLNYVHYDIDGSNAGNVSSGSAGSWFRETGTAQKVSPNNPVVLANSVTELVSYDYADAAQDWTGFAGSVYERDGVSRCAQTTSSFSYSGAQPSITFRMGYDYNAGGNIGRPVRQYGSRLGCFNFPSLSTLPVNLLSFSATYNNEHALLKWATDNEVNFEKFIIERSNSGRDFSPIAERMAKGKNGRNEYDWIDDLTTATGNDFYYRLKMLDFDGKFSYSPIIMVKKEAKSISGITINPNPVISTATSVRFTSRRSASVEFKVIDISGKTVLRQINKVYDGNNSVTIGNLKKLQPGTYILQMISEGESSIAKFSVTR